MMSDFFESFLTPPPLSRYLPPIIQFFQTSPPPLKSDIIYERSLIVIGNLDLQCMVNGTHIHSRKSFVPCVFRYCKANPLTRAVHLVMGKKCLTLQYPPSLLYVRQGRQIRQVLRIALNEKNASNFLFILSIYPGLKRKGIKKEKYQCFFFYPHVALKSIQYR